jgi:hypothetical protein
MLTINCASEADFALFSRTFLSALLRLPEFCRLTSLYITELHIIHAQRLMLDGVNPSAAKHPKYKFTHPPCCFFHNLFPSVTRELKDATPFPAWTDFSEADASSAAAAVRPTAFPFHKGALVTGSKVLTPAECAHYISETERLGLESVSWEYPKEYRVRGTL